MLNNSEELNEEVITELFDLIFEGRNKKTKTIGEPDSVSLENLSRKVLVRALLKEEVGEVEKELKNKVLEGRFGESNSLNQLMRLARTWKAMKLLSSDNGSERISEVFILDSLFLSECYDTLAPYDKEEEIFLTGVRAGSINVPTKRLEFETSGSGQEVADVPVSSHKTLKEIDDYGMPFLGAFHSHPNSGRPKPSNTDLQQFGKYEDHGYRILGGIFTKSGYIRFFTKDLDFELMITGKRVEKIEGSTYRLENPKV